MSDRSKIDNAVASLRVFLNEELETRRFSFLNSDGVADDERDAALIAAAESAIADLAILTQALGSQI